MEYIGQHYLYISPETNKLNVQFIHFQTFKLYLTPIWKYTDLRKLIWTKKPQSLYGYVLTFYKIFILSNQWLIIKYILEYLKFSHIKKIAMVWEINVWKEFMVAK